MSIYGCRLLGRQVYGLALTDRVADAGSLFGQCMLWLKSPEDGPEIAVDVTPEVVLLERVRVGVVQREVSECVADVGCVQHVSVTQRRSGVGTDRFRQTRWQRYTAGYTGTTYSGCRLPERVRIE